jgi:hypothetical protein
LPVNCKSLIQREVWIKMQKYGFYKIMQENGISN